MSAPQSRAARWSAPTNRPFSIRRDHRTRRNMRSTGMTTGKRGSDSGCFRAAREAGDFVYREGGFRVPKPCQRPTGLGGGKPHGEGRRPSRRGGIPTRWTAHCAGRQGFRRSWSRVSAKPTSIGHAETIASAKIMSSHHPDLPRTLRQESGGEQSVYRSMAKLRSS